eukprot:g17299.t1
MVATCAVSASAKEKFVREALLKQQDVAFPLELVKLSVAFYLGRASSDTTTNCNSSSAQTDESTRLKRTTSSSAPPSDAALCQGFLQLLVDTGCITKKDVFFGLLRTLGTTDELSLDCGPLKVERFLRELLCGLVQREWEYNDSTNMTQELSAAEAGEAGGGDDSAETAGKVVQRGEHFQLPEELKKCRILHVPGGAQAQEILSAVEADLPECFVPVFLDLDAELEKELQEHVLRSRTRTLSSLSGEEPGRCAPTEESRGASPCSDFVHVSEEDATFLTSSPSTIASQETKKHVDEEEGQLQPHSERTKLKGVEMVDDGRKMLSQEQEDSPSPRPPSSADEVKNTHSKVDDDNSHSRKITSIAADLLEFLVQVVQEVPAEAVTPGFTDALDELKKSGDRVGFNKGVRLAGMCEKLFGEGQVIGCIC